MLGQGRRTGGPGKHNAQKAAFYSSVCKPRQTRAQMREENKTADISFSKLALVASCCSGPLMQTHMQTQGKNPHGILPET